MTVAEKIISAHCSTSHIQPGDTVFVTPDVAFGSEIIFPQVHTFLRDLGFAAPGNPKQLALVNGHLVPTREAAAGTLVVQMDDFAKNHEVKQYYQAGRSGNCQTILAEKGLVTPGSLVVGSDQHATTYGAYGALATGVGGIDLAGVWTTGELWLTVPETIHIELNGKLPPYTTTKDLVLTILARFGSEGAAGKAIEITGAALSGLDMTARYIICNMLVETGARFIWIEVDNVTRAFLKDRGFDNGCPDISTDSPGDYCNSYSFDLEQVAPMVAAPYSPVNGIPARSAGDVEVHQVIVGGCTGGEIEDFRTVAAMLKKYKRRPRAKVELFPACHRVVREVLEYELPLLFTQFGVRISPPSCQPCLGSGPSMLEENQVGVYTTNRNYRGRHGPMSAQVYLAGPLVAICSAIAGKIVDPRDM